MILTVLNPLFLGARWKVGKRGDRGLVVVFIGSSVYGELRESRRGGGREEVEW